MSSAQARKVVVLSGEIDLDNEAQVNEQLLDAVKDGAATVVVDLGAVTFLGSTGLNLLIGIHNQLAAAGRTLLLANVPPGAARVLELTGMATWFETTDGPA